VRILAAEELRSVLDDGHAAPEAAVRLGEFEANIPAAEDDEVVGHPVEFEHLDVRERPGIRQAGDRWNLGVGPQVGIPARLPTRGYRRHSNAPQAFSPRR